MKDHHNVKDIIEIVRKQGYEVTRNKLIHYERNKLITPAYSKGGYRNYSEDNVKDILLICYFLDVGWSIKETRMFFLNIRIIKERINLFHALNNIFDKIERGSELAKEEKGKVADSIKRVIPATKESIKNMQHLVNVSKRKSKGNKEITNLLRKLQALSKEESYVAMAVAKRAEKPSINEFLKSL